MKKEIFKRLINDSREKDLSYVIDRDLQIPLDTGKIISIIGVRRSGKTHLLFFNTQIERFFWAEDFMKSLNLGII